MEGFQLGARFSLATNRLNYCGPADAEPVLYRAIVDGTGREAAERALSQFEALYPYLEAIARKHDRQPFDREVVHAYWIGNALLDDFTRDDFVELIAALVRRGLPAFVARELVNHLPDRPLPHHLFHVLFVGVGSVTGHVPTNLSNMEECRPAWAQVRELADGRLLVDQSSLQEEAGHVALGPMRDATIRYDPRVLPGVAPRDWIATHWGWAAMPLDPPDLEALQEYSRRSILAASHALP